MKELDFHHEIDGNDWWTDYLAYQASIPNNWVVSMLNAFMNGYCTCKHGVNVPKCQKAVCAKSLRPEGLALHWTIICLDGAPERMQYQLDKCGNCMQAAQLIAAPAEKRFVGFIDETVQLVRDKPFARIMGNWRDGAIIANSSNRAARIFVEQLSRKCASVNTQEGLAWNEQFHVRAGVGRSLHDAFAALLRARRDEAGFVVQDNKWSMGTHYMPLRLPTGQSQLTPVRSS